MVLSQGEAAEGVSERTFRRWRDEAEGGLYDRRLGRVSARRAGADEVAQVPELFDTRYRDFNARDFHEKPVACHGVQRSYVRLTLQAHAACEPHRPPAQAPAARAARRCTRTARATSGRPVGSGRHHGRRHQRAGLLRRRGRHPFQAPREAVGERRLFRSLYRGSRYFIPNLLLNDSCDN